MADGTTPVDGIWHHCVTVIDRDGFILRYLDGNLIGSTLDISSFQNNDIIFSNNLLIGARDRDPKDLFFEGFLDDIAIYNKSLTEEEIQLLYSGGESSTTQLCASIFCDGENVGIGTTTPDSKLTVNGTIHTKEVKVDLNGFPAPDFVFDEDYVLSTLEETEKYIQTNKHLSEILSANEMEANGINLKELNLKLLQKVEELTLYLIEQSKGIKILKNKVEVGGSQN